MASQYWGINRGQHETDVVTQTSSPGKDVELKVDLTKNLTKEEVIRLVEDAIDHQVVKGNWPPS
jgi:hypothetical protein